MTKKNKRAWSAREKLMIIAYYEKGHSKHSTANEFGIERKQLWEWIPYFRVITHRGVISKIAFFRKLTI